MTVTCMIMFTICQVVQLPTQSDILLKEWKTLGMLIPGKSHSWVDSRNSRVSIETLDFARVHTFPTAGGGTKGVRGVIAGRPQTPFLANAGTPSPLTDDRHSWRWRARTSQNGRGGYRWSEMGEMQWPSAPAGRWAGESPPPPSDAAGQSVDVSVYQVVGFFDVAAHLCAGDGPIAELVIVSGRVQL